MLILACVNSNSLLVDIFYQNLITMKKTAQILIALLAIASGAFSQNSNPWPSTGNVGIGTTTPNYLLDIQKVGNASSAPTINIVGYDDDSNSGAFLRLTKSRGTTVGTLNTTLSGDRLGNVDFLGINTNLSATQAIRIMGGQDGDAGVSFIPGKLSFYTSTGSAAATERMTIKSNGNIGIGTATPSSLLTISGGSTTSNILVKNTSPDAYPYFISENDLGVQSSFSTGRSGHSSVGGKTSISNNQGNAILLDPFNIGSNVAIGTYNPSARFVVKGKTGANDVAAMFSSSNDRLFTIRYDGFTGIGTASPNYSLDVQKVGSASSAPTVNIIGYDDNGASGAYLRLAKSRGTVAGTLKTTLSGDAFGVVDFVGINTSLSTTQAARIIGFQDGTAGATFIPGKLSFYTSTGSAVAIERMTIKSDGSIGIGTSTPDEKLTVNGVIHSKEVKVNLNVPAPDYVFEPDYKLTPLDELKVYLDKNRHLPEIPSATQMEKDGINLSDMNVKLLKKIEELTLYLIEQQQSNKELRIKLTEAMERLKALESDRKQISK